MTDEDKGETKMKKAEPERQEHRAQAAAVRLKLWLS